MEKGLFCDPSLTEVSPNYTETTTGYSYLQWSTMTFTEMQAENMNL